MGKLIDPLSIAPKKPGEMDALGNGVSKGLKTDLSPKGLMGKSSAPAAPDYVGQAIAEANSNKYSEQTPYGSVSWQTRPGADPRNPLPGDSARVMTLSPEQKQLYDLQVANQLQTGLAGSALLKDTNNGGDRQATQDALYRRATQYYDKNFDRSQAALETKLQNQGLMQGSEAYTNELDKFNQGKDTAYADATDRAVTQADSTYNANLNNNVSRLAQLLTLSRGQTPTSANNSAPGTELTGATNAQYQAQLGQVNAENATAASTTATVGSMAAMAAMYF